MYKMLDRSWALQDIIESLSRDFLELLTPLLLYRRKERNLSGMKNAKKVLIS